MSATALNAFLVETFGEEPALRDDLARTLEWVEVKGGQRLVEAGDPAAAVWFVVSGRLRAFTTRDGERVTLEDFGRGETVGEASVLLGEPHAVPVIAVRDSVLARVEAGAFENLCRRHPGFAMSMTRAALRRSSRSASRRPGRSTATICVVAITDGLDVVSFSGVLAEALGRWGRVTLQTRGTVTTLFGAGAADARPSDERYHRLSAWLDDVERETDFLVLVADDGETEWTRRCIRHADEVLFAARTDAALRVHPIEERLCTGRDAITAARQTLVLLHPEWRRHPEGTAAWIDRRPVDAHVHVRPEVPADMARLARIVSGNATGLVLSGGGARGFAHLGVLKAIEEAGISVDLVGGTSIGAVMAAYTSFARPAAELIEYARKAFARNPTGDYNLLPLVSLVKGRRLKKTIGDAIVAVTGSESDLLDSWRTLFCVASSFSGAREVVITRGPLERALRASVSIPVALPPVPLGGELLVDGGIFNNFPTDVMRRTGARRIIGVDLSRRQSQRCELEEMPGTWPLLRSALGKAASPGTRVPSLGTLLVGTTLLCSESRRELSRADVDVYVNPDLASVGLLDWKAFAAAVDLGYREASRVLGAMEEQELAAYRG